MKASLYADDLVMWCTEEHASTATYRMQLAAEKLTEWAQKWCVSINKEKSSTTLFTLSTKQKPGSIKFGDTVLKQEAEPTFLGITLDQRLSWKPHIQKTEAKARRKLAIMRKLAGTSWGANSNTLKTVYQGAVRPVMEYASSAWSSTSKTNKDTLDKVQNQALRIITGAMKSTPIAAMESTTGVQPLSKRRETKDLIQGEKYKALQDHPMQKKLKNLAQNRLKRKSFVHSSKFLSRQQKEKLPDKVLPLLSYHPKEPWNTTNSRLSIHTSIPGVLPGDNQSEVAKSSLTLAAIEERYPKEAWIHIYTDGSATNAISNGGAGVNITHPDGTHSAICLPTGRYCSNYAAESKALKRAADEIANSNPDCKQVVFFTDAMSVLQALQSNSEGLDHLTDLLSQVSKSMRTALQWVPSHCGLPGNEIADQLAKLGASLPQEENPVSFKEMKTLIKHQYSIAPRKDNIHFLQRKDQVIIFRLRTEHNRLKNHLHRVFRIGNSPLCDCGEAPQTGSHILQDCSLYGQLRRITWGKETPISTKLHGPVEELQRTATYITMTGLQL